MADELVRSYHSSPHEEYDNDGGISPGRRMGRLERTVSEHDRRIDSLESWRDEFRGAGKILQILLALNVVGIAVELWKALQP